MTSGRGENILAGATYSLKVMNQKHRLQERRRKASDYQPVINALFFCTHLLHVSDIMHNKGSERERN
jgi:hypothetical protein